MKISRLLLLLILNISGFSISYAQWQQTNGAPGGMIDCFAIKGSNIFIGTEVGVSRSTNNGDSWSAVNNGLPSRQVWSLAVVGNNIFAATGAGVFRSSDNGSSWTLVNDGLPVLYFYNLCSLVAIDTNIFTAMSDYGVYRLRNNGSYWSPVGLINNPIRDLTKNANYLFAGIIGTGVYVSTNYNSSASWTAANNGLTNLNVTKLCVCGGSIYAMTLTGGAFRSSDNGANWSQISIGSQDNFINSVVISGTYIFAANYRQGVYLSRDNGITWKSINDGLGDIRVWALTVSGTTLLAGTEGSGVWKCPITNSIGIKELNSDDNISVYPNPTTGSFEISGRSVQTVEILSGQGQLLMTINSMNNLFKTDISALPAGLYFLKIYFGKGMVVKKLIKE